MWNQARNAISMLGATVTGLELIGTVTRATDRPKEALGMISAIVTSLIEGFQGRLPARDVDNALSMLRTDLADHDNVPSSGLVEKFRLAL